jgi:hypothetical protein
MIASMVKYLPTVTRGSMFISLRRLNGAHRVLLRYQQGEVSRCGDSPQPDEGPGTMDLSKYEQQAKIDAAWWLARLEKYDALVVLAVAEKISEGHSPCENLDHEVSVQDLLSLPYKQRLSRIDKLSLPDRIGVLLHAWRHVRGAQLLLRQMALYNLTTPEKELSPRGPLDPYRGPFLGRVGEAAIAVREGFPELWTLYGVDDRAIEVIDPPRPWPAG